jgi:sugar lactone lactonase YvrE
VIQRLPTAFDVDRDGRLVVTDAAEQQVLMLDSFLTLTQTIGGPGSHREQFQDPSGVVFLPDGSFMVADRGNRRLQHYSRQGYFEQIVGGEFDLNNPLITPQGIDCDTYGNIFVADPAASDVHVYSRGLSYLFSLGSALNLMADPELPIDVAVGPEDLLAVADRGRSAILVFRIVYD